jgi:hypothetical protein
VGLDDLVPELFQRVDLSDPGTAGGAVALELGQASLLARALVGAVWPDVVDISR